MFCSPCRRWKKRRQVGVEVGDQQSSSPQKSFNVEDDPHQQTVAPDARATSATKVSTTPEAPEVKTSKASRWRRWLCCKKKHKRQAPEEQDALVSDRTEAGKKTTTPCRRRWLFSSHKVCPIEAEAPFEAEPKRSRPPEAEEVDKKEESTKVQANRGSKPEDTSSDLPSTSNRTDKDKDTEVAAGTSGPAGSQQAPSNNTGLWTEISGDFRKPTRSKKLSREELVCLGFPNLEQTCYINSTLQGLLTLRPFVQEVHNQERVWSSHPLSQIMRGFVEVGVCCFSSNEADKRSVLAAFKLTVAEFNSEFEDNSQKDAHEFLNCLLDMMRSLSFELQTTAVHMGIRYTCPVSAHIAFQMLSTRTCRGCGIQSSRVEDYVNLSLDLVPGGSVMHSLQEYLKEGQLEYRCQCRAVESTQRASFLTLPNVLILQLKRFRFTRTFSLQKVDSPMILSRELTLESGHTKQTIAHYSLVSIVSHLGSTAHSGHYICDSAYRELRGGVTDRWLTCNDSQVSETTGTSVCHQRQRTAYLLFYEKQQEEAART